ncbi:hypothetical protein PGB90_009489 [Kerria lacca]
MRKSKLKILHPTRITMLDAVTLDNEIFSILKSQLQTILKVIPPWVSREHSLKLDLLLHYIIWKLSICKFRGTFGQQLLNMKYANKELTTEKERIILLSQIFSYLHENDIMSSSTVVNKFLKLINIVFLIFELTNLLAFFCEGKYPTVTDRILNLKLVCIVNKPRSVGYNYMTRELMWHGFLELFTFTLSLINYQSIKRKIIRFIFKPLKIQRGSQSLLYTVNTNCAICRKSPVIPQHIGCSHVFCYYCIQTNRLVDSKYECPSCGHFQEDINFVCS